MPETKAEWEWTAALNSTEINRRQLQQKIAKEGKLL